MKTKRAGDVLPDNLADFIDPGHPRLGMGLDLATTTKKKSNPTVLALAQEVKPSIFFRLVMRWKTSDPDVTRAIISGLLDRIPHGLRVRGLAIDATSERFFASDLRSEFAAKLPVQLVVSSEGIRHAGEDMNYKTFLGNSYVNLLEDGYAALPADEFIRVDHRLVFKEKGMFDCDIGEDGGHGDVFDACKLAQFVLRGSGGPAEAHAAGTGTMGQMASDRPGLSKHPLARLSRKIRGGVARRMA
jgi:hypothetical protein